MSVADVRTAISEACYIFQLYENALQSSPDVNTQVEAVRALAGLEVFKSAKLAAYDALQAAMGQVISPSVIRATLAPLWAEYARELDLPLGLSDDDIIDRVNQSLIAAGSNAAVKSRGITFGTPSSLATNTGRILRLYKDHDGNNLEIGPMETLTFRCVKSFGQTNRYNDEWECRGQSQDRFGVDRDGSGFLGLLRGLGPEDSLLPNPRFNQGSAGMSGWTVATGTTPTKEDGSGYSYLPPRDGSTQSRIKISASCRLTRDLLTSRFDPKTPFHLWIFVDKSTGSGAGSVQIELGATTKSVNFSSLGSGWQRVEIDVGSGNWYQVFAASQTKITVALDFTISSGYVLLSHVNLNPFTPLRGQWYIREPGTVEPALEATGTVTDSLVGSDSVTQYMIQKTYGKSLRHNGTPDWADAS